MVAIWSRPSTCEMAATENPASPAQRGESDWRNIATHGIEDDVHRPDVSQRGKAFPPIFGNVVDRLIGSLSDSEHSLVLRGGGGDDVRSHHLAYVDRGRSGSSRCPEDEQILSGAQFSQLHQSVRSSQVVHWHGGGLSERQIIRYLG